MQSTRPADTRREETKAKYAYTTLITRGSYLAGVIVLAYTLRKRGSTYPLIVLYTPNLADTSILRALQLQSSSLNLILHQCDLLLPASHHQVNLIASRFCDTWTKLRVFGEALFWTYDAVCYLDADMAIFNSNMDEIFTYALRDLAPGYIAANHVCVCNLDLDSWAPEGWNSGNCAYTRQSHGSALQNGIEISKTSRPTHHLLNSGMFVYRPTANLWHRMLSEFQHSDKLATYLFPDQDFLTDFFHNRWTSIGWQWNGLKTMRYWHPNIWRDEEVVCLHYIVDKPWASRIGPNGEAGYLGLDGETHSWWWKAYTDWTEQCRIDDQTEALQIVDQYVAGLETAESGIGVDLVLQVVRRDTADKTAVVPLDTALGGIVPKITA